MAWAKKFTPKKWAGKKRFTKKAPSMTKKMAAVLTVLSNQHEVKSVDVPQTSVTPTSAGSFTPLNALAQGVDFFQRVGSKISMKSLHINGIIVPTLIGPQVTDYLRIMVVYDRQSNTAAIPSAATLLQDVQANGTTSSNSFAGINMGYRDRFLVLMDERVFIPGTTSTNNLSGSGLFTNLSSPDPVSKTFKFSRFIKMNELEASWLVAAGSAGTPSTGALSLFLINQQGTNAAYSFEFNARLRYDDL